MRVLGLAMMAVLIAGFAIALVPAVPEAAPLIPVETFSGGDPQGWSSNWTTDNASSPPVNRDLWTAVANSGSGSTGPVVACNIAICGGAGGSFLMYEASSGTPTERMFTANQSFDASAYNITVDFAYNMYGAGMGTLELQVDDSGNGSNWQPVWRRTGNYSPTGNEWYSSANEPAILGGDTTAIGSLPVDLSGYSGMIDIRFRFVYGTAYTSDHAIDSVTIDGVAAGPSVTTTTPADTATGVVQDSSVSLTWSEDMNCTTINTTNVTITGGVGWSRTSCSGSPTTAVFAPSGQVENTPYTVSVSTAVQNTGGTPMASAYNFTYTTEAVPPTVQSTSPANGATGATLDGNVSITWSENVNCATVNTTNITSDSPGWTFLGCSNDTATFTTSGQAEFTAYNVTVTTAVQDANGVAMASSYPFSFTTGAAGPPLAIDDCGDCHPATGPNDGAREDTSRSAVGSHTTHVISEGMACTVCHIDNGTPVSAWPQGLGHREGLIEMQANIAGGGYAGGTSFPQVTSPSLQNCTNTSCHYASGPTWGSGGPLACSSCHNYPPTAADGVDHVTGMPTLLTNHDDCRTCHLTKDSGSGTHSSHANYIAATNHGNGLVAINSELGYNQTNFGCDNACHGNDTSHRFSDSGMTIESLAGDPLACNSCHGYPPLTDGGPNDKHATGATPVNHELISNDNGAVLMTNHADCELCHGTKDDGSGNHSPNANYTVATNHKNGSITMNGPDATHGTAAGAEYNESNFGCEAACHTPNESTHQLTDSALPVEYGDFGSGSCTGCHADGNATVPANVRVYPSQFDPSVKIGGVHRVEGFAGNASIPRSTAAFNTFVSPFTVDSVLACDDCHNFSLHGGRSTTDNDWMLKWADTSLGTAEGIAGTPKNSAATTAQTQENFCINCHRSDVYGISGSGGSGWQNPSNGSLAGGSQNVPHSAASWRDDCLAPFGDPATGSGGTRSVNGSALIGCMNCHGGGYWKTTGNGGIHGVDNWATTYLGGFNGAGFVNGNAWNQGPATTNCYANPVSATWSTCTEGTHN